jgi:mannose-6-phosphate isomerase-like protein (cupin superfamily)
MVEHKRGFAIGAREGRSIWFLDALLTWKATGADTGGWELVEQLGPRGFGPPLHSHNQEAEGFYILDGEVSFTVGDREILASAGAFVYVPPDTAHSFVVESPVARFLTFVTPPVLESFLDELAEPATVRSLPPSPAAVDVRRFDEVAVKHGQKTLGPPMRPRT